jgi:hypothetical protein
MINYKVLLKSMTYLMLPTLVVFFLVFCWFLDWEAYKQFWLNREGWAGFLRIFIVGLEVLLVWYVYDQNIKELRIENPEGRAKLIYSSSRASDLYQPLSQATEGTDGKYKMYKIEENKFLIEYK